MNKIKFWNSWDADTRYPYLFLLIVAVLALMLGVYHYFTGESSTLAWDKLPELQVVQVPVHEFSRLLEPFTLYVDGYLLTEQYDVAPPTINTFAAVALMLLLALCLAFYAAAITTMKRIPYFAGMLLLMMLLASFNLDLLGVIGNNTGQTTLLIFIVFFALVTYAFQAFYQQVSFTVRVMVMVALISVLGSFLYMESDFQPLVTTLHLANYSSLGLLVASLLFMMWVGYENINALLWVNTQASRPERRFSIWQFVLVGTLYLVNLVLLYLRHVGYLKGDFFYINAFVILAFSAVAGFWGMRQRESTYGRLFPFKPTGAILYLVFATITFLSIGYAYATASDSLISVYHNLIVYTHLAFGAFFFLYVLVNFGGLIKQRLAVYKVVYQPKRLPIYTIYTMGAILMIILVMRTQFRVYFSAYAGYYSYLGDLYQSSENPILAERFYKESDLFDRSNMKANYSLAAMYRAQNDVNKEILSLQEALERRPNPKLYIRLANLYTRKEYFFEKLYVLQQGARAFPENGEIYNNLALHYSQTSVLDSVEYYYNLAQKHAENKDLVRSNRLAFYTRQAMPEQAKELLAEMRSTKYKPLRSNMAALNQLLGRPTDPKEDDFVPDSLESVEDLTLFYNKTIASVNKGDTSLLKPINRYLGSENNRLFMEDLLYLKGLVHHYDGRPKEARSTVENLALAAGERSGYYYNALGYWMMEEGNYGAAAYYFKEAKDRGFVQAFLSHAYALALNHQTDEAMEALREVGYTELESAIAVATSLREVLNQEPATIISQAPDHDKVQYLIAYLPDLLPEDVDRIVKSIQDKDLRREALVAKVDYYMEKRRWKLANEAIKEAAAALQPEGELRSKLNLQQMHLWLHTKNHDVLVNRLDNLYLTPKDKRHKLYFRAKIAEVKGRDREAAERYDQALKMLLYDERTVADAAAFFARYTPDTVKAYEILLDGITYNPFSASLYKAYALESVNRGLGSYADQALVSLRGLLPAAEYSTFKEQFDKKRRAKEAEADQWQL
jgi:cellulose synthase operon protein C